MIKVESGAEQDFFIGYDSYTKYEYYDPKLEIGDDVDENAQINAAKQKIQDTVKEFERRVIDNAVQADVEQVSHIPDFVDYWLIQEFARNNEGFTRSQYWHSFGNASEYGPFDSEESQIYDNDKIYISYVWDMNHSFAATIVDFDGWAVQNFFAVPQVWGQLFLKDWFQNKVYNRYSQLKGTTGVEDSIPIFNVSEINKLIDKFSDEMLAFNAVNRDQKRWYDGDVNDFNIYVKNLRKYILQRISWMDLHICSVDGSEPFISSDENNTVFNQTEAGFITCPEDDKNSNFMAVYNPFEGQVFDVNDLLNEFEIEIIFSATIMNNLLTDNLSAITVTIINSDTNQNEKRDPI